MNTTSHNGNGAPSPGDSSQGSANVLVPQRVHPVVQPGPGVPPAMPGPQVPLALELLKALRRRLRIAFALGLVCAGIAAAVVWNIVPPAKYTAQARFHISSIPPRIIFRTAEQHVDFRTYQNTQLALIKSRLVLDAALRGVEDLPVVQEHVDPVAWLQDAINANFSGEILRISMSGAEPEGLAEIVNAVSDAYLSEVVVEDQDGRRDRYEELQRFYDNYQQRMESQRATLHRLGQDLGTTSEELAQVMHQMALERRHMAIRELTALENRLRTSRIEYNYLREEVPGRGASGITSSSLIDELVRQDPGVQGARARVEEAEYALESTRRVIRRDGDPDVRILYERLESARRDLTEHMAKLRAWYAEHPPNQGGDGGNATIASLQRQIDIMEEQKALLVRDIEMLTKETKEIGTDYVDLEAIKNEIAKMEAAADRIGEEVEYLKVELDAPDRVEFIEPAEEPRQGSDKRLKMAGMGGGGAFALALLGIAWLEYQSRRINSADEVSSGLGLRIMGSLPPLRGRPRRHRLPPDGSRTPPSDPLLIESIDAARTHLLHTTRHNAIRSVMVTSAMGGEGKTSLACHLAASIARSGRSTLLVDCDLRKPALHRLFDQPPVPGFSELLRGQAGFDDVLRPTPAEGLWVIPAGQWDRRAVEALTHDDVRTIFEHLKQRFDFVVVDTPPVLPVADALSIGQHLDAALCSILRGVSRGPRVRAAHDRLSTLGIHVLGAVVAGVRDEAVSAGYQYQEAADG